MHKCVIKKVKLINHDCLPILMLLYTMLYIVLAYLMLFAALTNSVCLNNASFFFLFKYFLCQVYELSGEIALKNNHYYYYYYYAWKRINMRPVCWNIIKQIVKKYTRDTLMPTTYFTNATFRFS